jgi:uncharacterized protein
MASLRAVDTRSRRRLLGGLALVVLGCSPSGGLAPELHPELSDWPETSVAVRSGEEVHEVTAVVAADPEARRRGLQQVESLPEGAGMLFLFPRDHTSGFWMKDTLIPLEIAFVDAEGEVIETQSMEPCEEEPCPRHFPSKPYRAALEVPEGWFSERDVSRGDRLEWGEVPNPR